MFSGRSADREAANNVNGNNYQDAPSQREKPRKEKKEKPKKQPKEKKQKKQTQHEMQPQALYTDTVEDDDLTYEYIEPDEPPQRGLPTTSSKPRY